MTTTTRRVALLAALAALGAITAGGPRAAAAQQDVTMRRIFTSDSISAVTSQLSPDGRWIAMRIEDGDGGASLWIAPSGGGAPVRLTSAGHDDRVPTWFASGDRIAFVTTRFNRNGGEQAFLAVQAVDPATGRAIGVPRQVSTEPVARGGQPSPDGRWLPYVPSGTPSQLRIVPSNGGVARTVARVDVAVAGLVFAPDSRHLYYQEIGGVPVGTRFTLKRVAVSGDASPEVVATASHPLRILPADPRYVIHEVSTEPVRYELRTVSGEPVGAVSLPRGMSSPTYAADGWGIMGLASDWKGSVGVVPVEGGEPTVLVSGGRHWPEAWMPDASALIVDRPDGDGYLFEALSMDGSVSRRTAIPAGSAQMGWHSTVGPWMSYRVRTSPTAGQPTDALHAVNVLTGERREISKRTVRASVMGRGGYEQDGARWIYVERDPGSGRLQLRSADPATGASAPILTLPSEHRFGARNRISVHGNRIAYMQARGDSVDLYLVDGPSARPRKLASFSRDGDTVTWSWDGSQLAVADWLPGPPRRGGLHLVDVGAEASATPRVRSIDLGVENGCDSFTWTPDDGHVVMLCYGANGRIVKVRVRDGQLDTVLPSDRPQQIWEYYLSPDGRRVAYTVQRGAGTSVYVASFRSLVEGRR